MASSPATAFRVRAIGIALAAHPTWLSTASSGWVVRDGIFVLLGMIVLALAWSRLAFGDVSLLVFQDASEQVYPWWQYAVTELQSGRFPLWDPYTFAGRSHIGEGQEAVFYPPFLLVALLGRGWAFSTGAIHVFAFAHAVLAFCGAYLLARALGTRSSGALGCGLVYALGGYFTQRALAQLNIFDATAWVPFVPLGAVMVARTRQVRWSLVSGAALALSLLAGHAQPALHAALIMVVTFAFLCGVGVFGGRRLDLGRAALALVIVAVTAGSLAAVQLGSILGYQPLALRWVGTGDPVVASARVPLDIVAANPSLNPRLLPAAVLPAFAQIPDAGLYVGIAAVIAVACGAALHINRTRFLWLALLVLGVCLAMGAATPLLALVYALPLMDKVREPVRYLLLAHLSLAVLAGFGFDWLAGSTRLPRGLAVGLLALASLELGLTWSASLPSRDAYNGSSNREVRQYYSSAEADGVADFLVRQPGWFRVDLTDSPLPRNYGELLRVPTVGGYRATSPTKIQEFRDRVGWRPPDHGPDLLGVRFLVSATPLRDLPEMARIGAVSVYENPRAVPLARLVGGVEVVDDDDQALDRLSSADFDAAHIVTVRRDQASRLPPFMSDPAAAAEITSFLPDRVVMTARSSGSALLVTSLADYPGWIASLDGAPTPLITVNYAFFGVAVPAGQHTVEFDYRPTTVALGAALSVTATLTILGLLGWWLLCRHRNLA